MLADYGRRWMGRGRPAGGTMLQKPPASGCLHAAKTPQQSSCVGHKAARTPSATMKSLKGITCIWTGLAFTVDNGQQHYMGPPSRSWA